MPESGGPRARLRRMSYVDAVCWIGSCLAEALHHAHERGLVHLDIKPSNILLAADGQPLLLDFHLAHAALSAGQKVPLTLGGTPDYMSPEQRAAYDAVYRARTLPHALDRTSDLYSLGRLLYVAARRQRERVDRRGPLAHAATRTSVAASRTSCAAVWRSSRPIAIRAGPSWPPTCAAISPTSRCAASPIAVSPSAGGNGGDAGRSRRSGGAWRSPWSRCRSSSSASSWSAPARPAKRCIRAGSNIRSATTPRRPAPSSSARNASLISPVAPICAITSISPWSRPNGPRPPRSCTASRIGCAS